MPKSTRVLPAISSLLNKMTTESAPLTFASPNLIELTHMYRTASSEPLQLTSHDNWWKVLDSMTLGSQFRLELEQLARRDVCDTTPSKGTLSFLLDTGVAQMAVNLLPFIQHLVLKAGDKGLFTIFRIPPSLAQQSPWAYERSNVRERQIVSQGRDGGVVVLKHHPAMHLVPEDVVNVTGAGDTLVGSVLATLVQQPDAFHHPHKLNALVTKAQQVSHAMQDVKTNHY